MRRFFGVAVAIAVAAGALAAAAAADVVIPTTTSVNICPNVTQTSYRNAPDSPDQHGCGPMVISGPGDLGTFCSSANPLGAWTMVRDVTDNSAPSSGTLTFTVTGTGGTTVITTDVVMLGSMTLKALGSFAPGSYTLTVAFGGAVEVTNQVRVFLSSAMTGTFTVKSCLPTSAEQCKDGGWQSYGVFKNQGDCVSFVATEGKNPPG